MRNKLVIILLLLFYLVKIQAQTHDSFSMTGDINSSTYEIALSFDVHNQLIATINTTQQENSDLDKLQAFFNKVIGVPTTTHWVDTLRSSEALFELDVHDDHELPSLNIVFTDGERLSFQENIVRIETQAANSSYSLLDFFLKTHLVPAWYVFEHTENTTTNTPEFLDTSETAPAVTRGDPHSDSSTIPGGPIR
ncbi:MAG: hypothetical protein AAGB12_13935 [Pseudomonadota bacterium]